jgi:hypothetical protein
LQFLAHAVVVIAREFVCGAASFMIAS